MRIRKIPFYQIVLPALIINSMLIVLIAVSGNFLPPEIPLFYGQPVSTAQLAPTLWLALPAGVSLLLVGINTTLTKIVEDNFLAKALVGALIATTVLSTITIIKIIFLVGNLF